jgi:hypothetical protein
LHEAFAHGIEAWLGTALQLLLDETNNEQENHSTDDGVDDCCDNTAARGSPAAPNAKKSAVRGCLGNVRADLPWI